MPFSPANTPPPRNARLVLVYTRNAAQSAPPYSVQFGLLLDAEQGYVANTDGSPILSPAWWCDVPVPPVEEQSKEPAPGETPL